VTTDAKKTIAAGTTREAEIDMKREKDVVESENEMTDME